MHPRTWLRTAISAGSAAVPDTRNLGGMPLVPGQPQACQGECFRFRSDARSACPDLWTSLSKTTTTTPIRSL